MLAGMATGVLAASADASREPTRKEARAIEKGFEKPRDLGKAKIERIRVSTVRSKFAAVTYEIRIPEIPEAPPTRGSKTYEPPSPVLLKEKKGGKWKTVPKAPAKVKKDLKETAKSRIDISGETSAVLSLGARCSESGASTGRASTTRSATST